MATYIKIAEWARQNDTTAGSVKNNIRNGKITCAVKRNGFYYLPVDYSFQDSEDGSGIIETTEASGEKSIVIPSAEELYKQYMEMRGNSREDVSLEEEYKELGVWLQKFKARVDHSFLKEIVTGEYNQNLHKDVDMIFKAVERMAKLKLLLKNVKIETQEIEVEEKQEDPEITKRQQNYNRLIKRIYGDGPGPTPQELFRVLNAVQDTVYNTKIILQNEKDRAAGKIVEGDKYE